jgi:hypothetical protein
MEQQIKKYQIGGDVVSQEDPFSGSIDLSQIDPNSLILLAAQDRAASQTTPETFDANVERYQKRLMPLAYQAPKSDIFDLASELGAGILASQQKGGRNPYVGIGVGFASLSQKLKKDQEDNAKNMQEIGLQAFQLALKDEQQARDYMNQIDLKLIDNANKKQEYIKIEYEVVDPGTGDIVIRSKTLANIPSNYAEIHYIMESQNGNEVKLSDTTINMPDPWASYGSRKAVDAIYKQSQDYAAAADASGAIIGQVEQAYLLALQIEKEGGTFGPMSKASLGIRELVTELGFGDLFGVKAVAPQKALNQLAMGFTMAIVSLTKGAISNREMELFIQASPTLGSTYAGFMKQLELMEKLAYRKRDFYAAYLDKLEEIETDTGLNPTQRRIKLDRFSLEWPEANPLLNAADLKLLEHAIANPIHANDFNPRAFRKQYNEIEARLTRMPIVRTEAQYDALERGDWYRRSGTGPPIQK